MKDIKAVGITAAILLALGLVTGLLVGWLRSPKPVTDQHRDAVVRWLDDHGRAGKRENVTCTRYSGEVEDKCSITYMGTATDSGTIHGILLRCSDTAGCYPVGGW